MEGPQLGASSPYPDLPPPPSGEMVTQQIPVHAVDVPPGGPSRPPVRWTAAAKATAVVLTLTTVGAAGFGISQFTKVNDQRDTIAGLQGEIDDTNDDYDDLSERLDAANATITGLQGRVDEGSAQLADMTARHDALQSLFPLTASTLANLAPNGSWGLVNASDASQCTGFSDAAASCVPENFPTDIVVDGSADAGFTAASAWYPPVALTFDGTQWTGSGPLSDSYSNTCGGAVNTTTVQLSFSVTGATGDDTTGNLLTAQLTGTVNVASGETEACVAAARSASFVTAAG